MALLGLGLEDELGDGTTSFLETNSIPTCIHKTLISDLLTSAISQSTTTPESNLKLLKIVSFPALILLTECSF